MIENPLELSGGFGGLPGREVRQSSPFKKATK